jgi:hypothetical protein
MTSQGLIDRDRGLALTECGTARLRDIGIAVEAAGRRPPLRECVDWTERRIHLAGSVGAAICRHAFDHGWIRRVGTGRAVKVTDEGADAFGRHLGVLIEPAARDGHGAAHAAPAGVRRP